MEVDDEWFRPTGGGRGILRQRLARTVADGTSIDTTLGMEYTEWVEFETFPEGIALFSSDKEQGAREAKRHTDGPNELSFWTNGSRLNSSRTGASIA